MTGRGARRRSWWGWGWEDQALTDQECVSFGAQIPGLPESPLPIPSVADLDLPAPRIRVPGSLAQAMADDPSARASHDYGKAYRDVVRALHHRIDSVPDIVAHPVSEDDVVDVLDWAAHEDVADLLVESGARSVTVDAVEASSGVAKSTLYRHFSSRRTTHRRDHIDTARHHRPGRHQRCRTGAPPTGLFSGRSVPTRSGPAYSQRCSRCGPRCRSSTSSSPPTR